jgi:hypothetical protein
MNNERSMGSAGRQISCEPLVSGPKKEMRVLIDLCLMLDLSTLFHRLDCLVPAEGLRSIYRLLQSEPATRTSDSR